VRFTIFILGILSVIHTNAQVVVSGKIIDSKTAESVPFAAVLLKNNTDTTKLYSTQSDENGAFTLTNIPKGFYRIMARSVGYQSYISRVTIASSNINLGEIKLSTAAIALKDVEVITEKPFIQIQGDKQVINVEKNMLTTGGTAQDVLKTLPSISVDMDGAVSFRGNTSVQIWIDGKPAVGGGSMAQLLQQLPASNISKVEMITNPSAKYDAEGTGGIINIVTKTPEGKSFGGYVDASWLVYNKTNLGAGIQGKKGKWAYNLNYTFRYDPRGQYGSGVRKSTFNDIYSESRYFTGEYRTRMSHGVRGGLEYIASEKSRWLLSFSVTPNRSDTYESQSTTQTDAIGDTTLLLYRITDELSRNIFANGSLSWRKKMANKLSLSTDLQYSGSFRDDNTQYRNRTSLGSYFGSDEERNLNNSSEQNFIYNLDFTKEFRKNETIEFGVRTATMYIGGQNNYSQFEDSLIDFSLDSNRSNNFNYLQEVAAGYFMYKQTIKKFNYGFGLRAEYTIVRGNELSRNLSVTQNYFNLFPSGSITYSIGKNQQINGSYSLRINRPRMRQLLPVGDYGDVQNVQQGNIALKPEIIHSLEANYNITFLKQYFSAGIFYKHILNSIAWKREFINEEISRNTFVNADANKNLGFEVIMKNQFFKIWEITSSYNASYIDISQTEEKSTIRNTGWRHILKTMTNVTFWKETGLQASYNYYSPNVTLQGSFHGFMTLDAGLRKMFLNKQLSVAFNVNDILNTQQFYGIGSGENFEQNFLRKRETRTYVLSLNYKFGVQDRKSRRERGGMDDSGGMEMDF